MAESKKKKKKSNKKEIKTPELLKEVVEFEDSENVQLIKDVSNTELIKK